MNTIEHIIQTKSFDQLTSDEMDSIKELVANEDDFNQMKALFGNIADIAVTEQYIAPVSVKKSLDQVFLAKHPGIMNEWHPAAPVEAPIVPIYQRNWFRIAAIFILFLGTVPFFFIGSNDVTTTTQTAQKEPLKSNPNVQKQPATTLPTETPSITEDPNDAVYIAALPESHPTKSAAIPFEEEVLASSAASIGGIEEPVAISYRERGMSADLFFNSSKDLASKSFAQPVAPNELLSLISPAF